MPCRKPHEKDAQNNQADDDLKEQQEWEKNNPKSPGCSPVLNPDSCPHIHTTPK